MFFLKAYGTKTSTFAGNALGSVPLLKYWRGFVVPSSNLCFFVSIYISIVSLVCFLVVFFKFMHQYFLCLSVWQPTSCVVHVAPPILALTAINCESKWEGKNRPLIEIAISQQEERILKRNFSAVTEESFFSVMLQCLETLLRISQSTVWDAVLQHRVFLI